MGDCMEREGVFENMDDPNGCEAAFRQAYGVYCWIRDNPVIPESGTSRMLKRPDFNRYGKKLEEEINELWLLERGEHYHTGDRENDFRTESNQVWYWMAIADVVSGLPYESIIPHSHAMNGFHDPESTNIDKPTINATGTEELNKTTKRCMKFLGSMCKKFGCPPTVIAVYDLEQMKKRLYLHDALREVGYLNEQKK